MKTQTSFSDLEYVVKKKRERRDRFLGDIEAVTPWRDLAGVIKPHYPKDEGWGRPPIGVERMLRTYIAQTCFGFSDEGIVDAIYASQAIHSFVGIDLVREIAPDVTTLLKFRWLLEEKDLTTHQGSHQHRCRIGLRPYRGGHCRPRQRRHPSQDLAAWRENRRVRGCANQGVEKQKENLKVPVIWDVPMKPNQGKALPTTPLGELRDRFEYAKASISAKVEHALHVVKSLFRHRKIQYRGLDSNSKQSSLPCGLPNLVLAHKW